VLRKGWNRALLAAGLVAYLRRPLDPAGARAEVRARLQTREATFLRLARETIFGQPQSPYLPLLRWAGWDHERLERSVEEVGLETTLTTLRDQGMWISSSEFKGREPIRRDGLVIEPRPRHFDNSAGRRSRLSTATGGTASGVRSPVSYSWQLFRDEAALELLLFESHGLTEAPSAVWLPALPGIAGLHNVLVQMRFRRPPERWFSQARPRGRDAAAIRYVQAVGRAFGMRVPAPEAIGIGESDRVASWLHSARKRSGAAALKTFSSSATEVAEAARRLRLDLTGCVIFAGGEPLTERRIDYVESTGARVFARYVATETGWIAAGCPQGQPGRMHLYSDRIAAVVARSTTPGADPEPLLLTSLTASAPKVLLNVDIGDAGHLRSRRCPCALGEAGLELEVSGVHGHDKVSGAGVTVPVLVLRDVLDQLLTEAGAAPDSYQLREEDGDDGASRVLIMLEPEVDLAEDELLAALLELLPSQGPEGELAASLWRASGAIEIRRERASRTASGKRDPAATRGG
jgi:hypothetical protein